MSIFKPLATSAGTPVGVDFESVARLSPLGLILTDATLPDNPIIYVNAAFETITGYPAREAVGRNCRFLQGEASDPRAIRDMHDALADGREIEVEIVNYRKSGEPFWNQLRIGPRHNESGDVIGFIALQNDITARRAIADEAQQLQSQLTAIVDNMPGYVFQRVLKRDGTLVISYLSSFVVSAIGIPLVPPSTVEALWDYIHPGDRQAMRDALLRSAADLSPITLEFRIRTTDGRERWIRNHAKARMNEAGDVIWDGVGVDFTEERLAEDRVSHLALHDPLTGMANRLNFSTSLATALVSAEATGDRIVLMNLDLDDFAEVNEAVGQQAADVVLKELARRITEFATQRHGEAARMGGDEFALFYPTPAASDDFGGAADSLRAALAAPIAGSAEAIIVDASVGTAYFPFHPAVAVQSNQSELMRRASVALHRAKQAGRSLHRAYTADAADGSSALQLRQALRHAISAAELRLHFQPLVDIATGTVIGAEALVRWQHPGLGLLPPGKFIPLAESSGLMVPLGDWIFDEAMRQVRAWDQAGIRVQKMSINISALQLREPSFVDGLGKALERHGVQAEQFVLELTEGIMIDASEAMLASLNRLRQLGFRLSVDDFGAGHASFQYLRNFPINQIKIDQTFVKHMVVDSSDASIIRAILQLGRTLQLEVVAEGIETVAQRDFLRDAGCRIGQGYLYSKPLPPEDFARLLRKAVPLPLRSPAGRMRVRPAAPGGRA